LEDWHDSGAPGIPMSGFGMPTRLRESAGRLRLSNHWAFRAAGVLAVLTMAGIFALAPFVPWRRTPLHGGDVLIAQGMALMLVSIPLILLYVLLPTSLTLDRARGTGTVRRGGWPFRRIWTFPLRSVSGLLFWRLDSLRRDRFDGRLVLDLAHKSGNPRRVVALAVSSERRAKALADRLSAYLGVKVESRDLPDLLLMASVHVRRKDGSEVVVAGHPVNEKHGWWRTCRLVTSEEGDRLSVVPGWGAISWTVTGIGQLGLTSPLLFLIDETLVAVVPVIPSVFCAGLVVWSYIRLDRIHFCRDIGWIEWTSRGKRRDLPLARVAAIQLAYAGWQTSRETGRWRAFELNLALDDGKRATLEVSKSPSAIRRHAEVIADFIGTPLVDQMGGF